jgi:hypothetical protein
MSLFTRDRAANLDLCLALMAVRVLLCATSVATQDLGLHGLIQMTGPHVPQWDSNPRRIIRTNPSTYGPYTIKMGTL